MYDRPTRSSNSPAISQSGARAIVKWFNPTKGFGFVTPEDGSPDAFLHISAVQAAGHETLPEGAIIVCDLSHGPKGPQVAAITSVDTSTTNAGGRPQRAPSNHGDSGYGAPRGDSGYGAPQRSGGWAGDGDNGDGGATVDGTVKWFNADKGFGFVAPHGGGKDIFIHRSALERSGLHGLTDGEPVRLTVRQGQKGPEAVRVEII